MFLRGFFKVMASYGKLCQIGQVMVSYGHLWSELPKLTSYGKIQL